MGDGRDDPRHLLREALYEDLAAGERVRHHLRVPAAGSNGPARR